MMLTTKQALKFVAIASKGPSKVYFETLLGDGEMPSVKDFSTDDAEGHERAGCLLDLMQTIIDELTDQLRNQPVQLDLTKPAQTSNESMAITCENLHPDKPPPSGKEKGGTTKKTTGKKKTSKKPTPKKKPTTKKKGKNA